MTQVLLDLFNKIKLLNPDAILTGSVALTIQNIKLRSLPNDLDIHMPFQSSEFIPLDSFTLKAQDNYFDDEPISRISYIYHWKEMDIKIDVFHPYRSYYKEPSVSNHNGVICTNFIDILKFKMKHAFNLQSKSSNKHSADLIFIFLNNTNLKYLTFGNVVQNIFGTQREEEILEIQTSISLIRPIIFFDTETTGVNKVKDKIIELSAIKIFPNGNRDIINERFNPQMLIPIEATAVHKITDEDVRDKPTFAQRAKDIFDFFKDCDLGGYNIIEFDVPLLVEEFLRANIEIPFDNNTNYVDSLKLFYLNQKRDLSSAYKFYCEKNLVDAHAAEVDNLATIEILSMQIERHKLPRTVSELHSLCNDGEEILDYERKFTRNSDGIIIFTFGKHKDTSAVGQEDYLEWMLKQDFANYTKLIIKRILNGELCDSEDLVDDED